ncbi:MAG TPA: hypothetical protein VN872_13000 [Candidatus Acidoferrum sp.]|nr:hypothetical protein [Candidatus Acidoferrum sp.]
MAIKPYSGVWTSNFPPHLDEAGNENHIIREAFTWGPQSIWMLCGLVWLFYYYVRDIPQLARNTALIGTAMTALSAIAGAYELRRRRRRISLYPYHERVGCYSGGVFQHSFATEEMRRVRPGFYGWMVIVLKGLLPMLMVTVGLGAVMYDAWRKSTDGHLQDMWLFVYAMLCAIFGFVAILRSNLFLVFFWIPNGKGQTDCPLHLPARELQKLDDKNMPSKTYDNH